MRKLMVAKDAHDKTGTFALEVMDFRKRPVTLKATVMRDKNVKGDGILWAMQGVAMIKDYYTEEERAINQRVNSEEPVRHGDVVEIEGNQFKVRVLGNYSDAAVFDPI